MSYIYMSKKIAREIFNASLRKKRFNDVRKTGYQRPDAGGHNKTKESSFHNVDERMSDNLDLKEII